MQFNASVQFLQRQTASLLLYQMVLQAEVGQAFLRLLAALQPENLDPLAPLWAYGQWFQALVATGLSWHDYLLVQLLRSDNAFTRQAQLAQLGAEPLSALAAAARQDLRALQHLHSWTGQLNQWVQEKSGLEVTPVVWQSDPAQPTVALLSQQPIWTSLNQTEDWAALLPELTAFYRQFGTGLFADYGAFRWLAGQPAGQVGQLSGIRYPDPIQLEELVGYETQKAALKQNTEALLSGYRALHVLLYGSRGTGKSSLIKALLSAYRDQGLRLIEVSKVDLGDLPQIMDQLRDLPQKFVIFVDDLSFEADDDAYKALKVVLEGNLVARPQNTVLYATSNRRHLIREFFGDRPRPSDADEIHSWDTVQEKLSFSDRFGLTLTFEPPDQDRYLEIVRHLAQQAALAPDQLEFRALQWATRHNGRSGRTARQFIDFLQADLQSESPADSD